MDPTARSTGIVVALVIAGLLMGMFLGGLGEPDREVVVQTVEVTDTRTVAKTTTVTRTVTVDAATGDDLAADTETTEDGDDCSDAYAGACIPRDADRGDLSCSQIPDRNFDSFGDDPYGLDPDGDGVACET